MSDTSETATTSQANLERKLAGAWRRERAFSHLRGLGRLIPYLIGIFLVDLALDWGLDLPGSVRIGLLAINVVVVGWLVYREWFRHLHSYDATRVSLQVEKLHPGLQSLVVSYVQLGRKKAHGSRWMIDAAREQAVAKAGRLDFSGIVDFSKLTMLLAIGACVVVAFAVSFVYLGAFYVALVGRMLMPFSDLRYPTRTRIEAIAGPAAVKQGDNIDLEAMAGGIVPDEGSIVVSIGNAGPEKFLIARGQKSDFAFHLPKATQSIKYAFRIGDARSEEREVEVVPPPRMLAGIVRLRYLSYTGRAPEELKLAEVRAVPEGSALAWEVTLDQPIKSGKIVFGGDKPSEVAVEPDATNPRVVRVSVPDVDAIVPPAADRLNAASVPYHFEWTELAHGFTFTDSTRYLLEVAPDRPPVITVYKPGLRGENDKALATTKLVQDFQYAVADDYAPGKARIVFRVNGGPEKEVALGAIPKLDAGEVIETKWRIAQWHKDLKVGDVVSFQVEATDNRATKAGPNVTRSPVFRVNIVDEKEYQSYIDRQVAQGLERTTGTAQEVLQSSKKLKALVPERTP